MNAIGHSLRKLRQQRKLSQKEFGKLFDLAESTIGMYERDERKPDYETLVRIADYFEVSTDELLGRSHQLKNTVNVNEKEITLSTEELQLLEELKKHPIMFHDLATDPQTKVKELIKLYKIKQIFLGEDT